MDLFNKFNNCFFFLPLCSCVFLKLSHSQPYNKPTFFQDVYTPEIYHGTSKEVPGKGDSFWKPSFSGSMLNFGGVTFVARLFQTSVLETLQLAPVCAWPAARRVRSRVTCGHRSGPVGSRRCGLDVRAVSRCQWPFRCESHEVRFGSCVVLR